MELVIRRQITGVSVDETWVKLDWIDLITGGGRNFVIDAATRSALRLAQSSTQVVPGAKGPGT
jgi:hypothetical protein